MADQEVKIDIDALRNQFSKTTDLSQFWVQSSIDNTLIPAEEVKLQITAFVATDVNLSEEVRKANTADLLAIVADDSNRAEEVINLVVDAARDHVWLAGDDVVDATTKIVEDIAADVKSEVDADDQAMVSLNQLFIDFISDPLGYVGGAVTDAVTGWAQDLIAGAIEGSAEKLLSKSIMGDVSKGTKLGEIMATQAPEVVKKGSPSIRANFEKAELAVATELDTNAKKLIDEMTKGHSPITPDESTIAAGTIGAGSIAGFVALAAAGSAIEAASLGQLEIPGHTLIQLGSMYGLMRMAGAIVSVPYKWAVDVGHNYKWASVFQPMIPGMTDLVRMEVREVWRDEFRAEQLEEPPSEKFGAYAAYQGFGKEHADSYWAAHWVLPTTGQAYEMFHRLRPGRVAKELEFTREDLYTLMRRADILKRYRDPLIAIAYDIPTRREIRMMVNTGDLTRDEAEAVYLDRGIDPKFAGKLADFAWSRAQRDPYRERIITACIAHAKEGYDTEDKFRERLKKREVPKQVIADAWELAQIQYEFDYKRDLLAELRDRLRKEKITIETFAAELSRIVPVAERANTIVERERARIKLEAS